MPTNFYALLMPPGRVVATELDSYEAAELLDAGQTVLLGNLLELVRLATRRGRSLTVFARDEMRGSHIHSLVTRANAADAALAEARGPARDVLPLAG